MYVYMWLKSLYKFFFPFFGMAAVKSQEFPTSSLSRCKSQVFLSFRGKDTRRNFTDHLYSALVDQASVHTFRDDDEIPRGENIESEIDKAIEQSEIAIVVLSENYASSSWCLDELAKIMEQQKNGGLKKVIPIFYHVCTSHVEEQTGKFGTALAEHEKRLPIEQVNGWRNALKEVAGFAGKDIGEEQHEAKVVKSIVNEVSEELNPTKFYIPYFIGRGLLMEDICSWLKSESNGSEIAMLYGIRRVGKTTIAKRVYNIYSDDFESKSFLGDIGQISKQSGGLVSLQNQLLEDVLKKNASRIRDVNEGTMKIMKAICCKRIFLVLDDLDTKDQFDDIIGKRERLVSGSKIIVTTTNENLFAAPKECVKFKVEHLLKEEKIELFSQHAFAHPLPDKEFEELSIRIVHHCDGLPSTLRRLGSTLSSTREEKDWETVLQEIRKPQPGGLDALCKAPDPPIKTVGFDKALGELKMELFKEGVSVVALSAPPGCGKTTLARLLCHDTAVKEKFKENIFYVTVSKNTRMESIVRRLFRHEGYEVGEFHSDEDVVCHLEQFLKSIGSDPILLVLDDVWPDWKSHLEKFRSWMMYGLTGVADLKILVTSRSTFEGLGYSHKLRPLEPKDTMTLFRQLALPPQPCHGTHKTCSQQFEG